jgi:hypothetical protein
VSRLLRQHGPRLQILIAAAALLLGGPLTPSAVSAADMNPYQESKKAIILGVTPQGCVLPQGELDT